MTRRSDPERIYEAKRAGVLARWADRVSAERAEELMAAWEAEAEARGMVRGEVPYWADANVWLQEQLKPKAEGPKHGFEEIPLDLDLVPTVEDGLRDAAERRKELADTLLMGFGGATDGMLFPESMAFSSERDRLREELAAVQAGNGYNGAGAPEEDAQLHDGTAIEAEAP